MPTVTIRVDGRDWVLNYIKVNNGMKAKVDVPKGFPKMALAKGYAGQMIQDKLGIPVLFENIAQDSLPKPKNFEKKKSQAIEIVGAFLKRFIIAPKHSIPPIEIIGDENQWLFTVPLADSGNSVVQKTNSHRNIDVDMVTEGITPRRQQGKEIEKIYMNGSYFTVWAIVHEIFHSLSDDIVSEFWTCGKQLEEAMTEYMTCLASDLYYRKSRKGNPIYQKELIALRTGRNQHHFTEQDIFDAYFGGDKGALKKIFDSFNQLWKST